MTQLYDAIGTGYANLRRPDPRIAAAIDRALGNARFVVNVGAGAGSYEPTDRRIVAVEPSLTMIQQRSAVSTPVVRASAIALPFDDGQFDGALAVLTLHHWPDRDLGLRELARVTRGPIVILTWDPMLFSFWLTDDYFPDMIETDRPITPTIDDFRRVLGEIVVHPLPIPHDCTDGFLGAYWRRPHAYIDPHVRAAISSFSKLSRVEERIEQLRRDLADGTWAKRHNDLLGFDEIDLGYRLVVRPPIASPFAAQGR